MGYTGFKQREYEEGDALDPRVPIGILLFLMCVSASWISNIYLVGYSGWYPGKVSGKLGKVDLHRGPISRVEIPESEAVTSLQDSDDDGSPSSKSVRVRRIRYREANTALSQKKISIDSVLNGIRDKFEDHFPALAEKRIHVLKPFQVIDKARTGRVDALDFEHCLIALNVVLPWAEQVGIQAKYDPDATGQISSVDFVRYVCPALGNIGWVMFLIFVRRHPSLS